MNNTLTHYWTTDEVAALSDEGLNDLIAILQNGERVAFAARNGRAQRRYEFLLERLAYPEQDRRRRAAK